MNGYFNNLAIRTVSHGSPGQGNVVQPRMASVYETTASSLATDQMDERGSVSSSPVRNFVAATDSLSAPSPENVVETATESSLAPVVSHEQPALPVIETAPQPAEPEVRVMQAVPLKTTHVLPASPAPVNGDLGHEDTTTVVLPETTTRAATTAAATTPARNASAQQPRPAAAVPAPLASTAPAAEVEKSINEAQPERSSSPSVKSEFHETETLRSTHHFTEHLTKQTKQTKESKQFIQTTTRREPLLLESAPDPEPSINITIGRVEVRAIPTASPKQKNARTTSPVMPLEEYLRKQRRGDER